jgi:hypothetical protein
MSKLLIVARTALYLAGAALLVLLQEQKYLAEWDGQTTRLLGNANAAVVSLRQASDSLRSSEVMIEKLNESENLLGVVLIAMGAAMYVLAAYWHAQSLSEAGAAIVGAGGMAFKGTRQRQ